MTRKLENERKEALTLLMKQVEGLKLAAQDGTLAKDPEDEALKSLIGAMDDMGLNVAVARSSSEVTTLEGRTRMSGVNSEDEWVPE